MHVRATDRDAVDKALIPLLSKPAFTTSPSGGWVSVFPEEAEEQDGSLGDIAQVLSKVLKTTVLAILDHDSDVFLYWLYKNGDMQDEYNSRPQYFETGDDYDEDADEPTGGDVKLLCAVPQGRSDEG